MSIGTPQEKRIFDTMSLKDALSYCYVHRKEFIAEQSQESFDCLIVILEDGTIHPANLPEYGMDFEEDAILHEGSEAAFSREQMDKVLAEVGIAHAKFISWLCDGKDFAVIRCQRIERKDLLKRLDDLLVEQQYAIKKYICTGC